MKGFNKSSYKEDIEGNVLDYVIACIGTCPYLADNLDNLISDINEEENTSGVPRYWKKEDVKKITLLLQLINDEQGKHGKQEDK